MEKRRKAQEANLLKRLESRLYTEQTHSDTALKISLPVKGATVYDKNSNKWTLKFIKFIKHQVIACMDRYQYLWEVTR